MALEQTAQTQSNILFSAEKTRYEQEHQNPMYMNKLDQSFTAQSNGSNAFNLAVSGNLCFIIAHTCLTVTLFGRPSTSWRVRCGCSSLAPGRSPATTRATPPTRMRTPSRKVQNCTYSRKAAASKPALQPGRPAKMVSRATKMSPRSRPLRQEWHSRGALLMQSLIKTVKVLALLPAIQRSK